MLNTHQLHALSGPIAGVAFNLLWEGTPMRGMKFWTSRAGYSLIEMIVVAALVMVGSAIAIPVSMQMVRSARGDSALTLVKTFVQTARNRAIAERRNMQLTFTDTGMQLHRIEVPSGVLTLVDTLVLEDGYEWERGDLTNPDSSITVAAGDAVDFTGDEPVMFTSDGSLIDANGDVTNGVLFLQKRAAEDGSRAIAIWGVTGLVRTWRWGGSEWIE
jgi:Tfp pilus assembly protein FimT